MPWCRAGTRSTTIEEYDRAGDKYFRSSRRPTIAEKVAYRMLFGSDYPPLTPERWMKDFEEAGFTAEVQPLILKENAKRLLQLGREATGG